MIKLLNISGAYFLSYEALSLDFSTGLNRIEGFNFDKTGSESNYTGKSTLIDLFAWIYFGKTIRNIQAGDVITANKSDIETRGVSEFELDDKLYRISRSRRTGKYSSTQVKIEEGGKDITPAENPQKFIDWLIGVDYKTFLILSVFSFYTNLRFISLTNREQKDIIEAVISFDRFEKYKVGCADRIKDLLDKINTEQTSLLKARTEKTLYTEEIDRFKDIEQDQEFDPEVLREKEKKLARLSKELERLTADHRGQSKTVTSHHTILLKIKTQLGSVSEKMQKIQRLKDTCPTCLQPIDEKIQKKLNRECSSEIEKFEEEKEKTRRIYEKAMEKEEEISLAVDEITETINKIRVKIASLQTIEKRVVIDEKRIEYLKGTIELSAETEKLAQLNISKHNKKIEHYDWLEKAWSPEGIESLLFDTLLPFLNERGNYYLKNLSDSRLSLNFSTLKTSKTGNVKDSFNVQIDVFEGGTSYGACSGSEEKFADIAVQLALRDLCRAVGRRFPPILFFDEIFDSIDDVGCHRILNFLKQEIPDTIIWVITHKPALKQYADNLIKVVMEKGVSRLD